MAGSWVKRTKDVCVILCESTVISEYKVSLKLRNHKQQFLTSHMFKWEKWE